MLCKRVLAQNMSITGQQPVLCHTLNSIFLINGLRESCQVKCLHTCPADSAGVGLSLHKAQLEALILKLAPQNVLRLPVRVLCFSTSS